MKFLEKLFGSDEEFRNRRLEDSFLEYITGSGKILDEMVEGMKLADSELVFACALRKFQLPGNGSRNYESMLAELRQRVGGSVVLKVEAIVKALVDIRTDCLDTLRDGRDRNLRFERVRRFVQLHVMHNPTVVGIDAICKALSPVLK